MLCVSYDIDLMNELNMEHIPSKWHIFIDLTKCGLKTVLLHNINEKSSILFTHSVTMKENYDNLATILNKVAYE